MRENSKRIGDQYEEEAVTFLKSLGYEIIVRNYRCRMGEIDIIAKKDQYLCFIEVKYRCQSDQGGPFAAVNWKKQKKICKVSTHYMLEEGILDNTPCRYDIVGITPENIELMQNAFSYIG